MTEKNTSYEEFLAGIDRIKDQAHREAEGLGLETVVETEAEISGPIGYRVRDIREQKGLTLADVASRTGFDQDFLSRIEAGELSPPLGVLIKLGKALEMKMGFFISGGEYRPYTIVRKGEHRKVSRRASSQDQAYGYTYESLAPGKANRHMEPFLVTLEPSAEEQLSTHEGQEFIYVLEGKMEVILAGERIVLAPGDTIYYDSNMPHMVRCVDGPSTRILAVLYAYEK